MRRYVKEAARDKLHNRSGTTAWDNLFFDFAIAKDRICRNNRNILLPLATATIRLPKF
jgi:hypothetical protein